MPEHRFSYPRVVPAPAGARRPDEAPSAQAASAALARPSQRELVAASLVRCPPRDGRLPGRLTR